MPKVRVLRGMRARTKKSLQKVILLDENYAEGKRLPPVGALLLMTTTNVATHAAEYDLSCVTKVGKLGFTVILVPWAESIRDDSEFTETHTPPEGLTDMTIGELKSYCSMAEHGMPPTKIRTVRGWSVRNRECGYTFTFTPYMDDGKPIVSYFDSYVI